MIENNQTLRAVNLETNYLGGDFFGKLFKAALKNQTLEEVKAVNQVQCLRSTHIDTFWNFIISSRIYILKQIITKFIIQLVY